MGLVSGIAVFVITWWTVLLAVLPWGVETAETDDPGYAVGAPRRPRIALKMAVTTAITVVVWLAVDAVVLSGWISFRALAGTM